MGLGQKLRGVREDQGKWTRNSAYSPPVVPAERRPSSVRLPFRTFIKDDTFTFFVGAEKQRYTVHISALKPISEPLGFMMTNGAMSESINGEATLEDDEPAVFEQLLQFAYLGLCGIFDGVVSNPARSSVAQRTTNKALTANNALKAPSFFRCSHCGQSDFWQANFYPYCGSAHYDRRQETGVNHCAVRDCRNTYQHIQISSPLCSIHDSKEFRQYFPDPTSLSSKNTLETQKSKQTIAGASFLNLEYGTAGLTHEALSNLLNQHVGNEAAPPSTTANLLQHAKVYIIAHKYMVKDLQDISLHKLHRSLAGFKAESKVIDEMIDLVLLVYSETSDSGDILHGTNNKLRELVMLYVADQSRQLKAYESFRAMIAAGGAHTADFFALKYARGEY